MAGVKSGIPIILCASVADFPAGFVMPSTMQSADCVGCGQRVYLAACSRVMIDAGKGQPVCRVCALRHVITSPGAFVGPFLPAGAVEEMAGWEQERREQQERN